MILSGIEGGGEGSAGVLIFFCRDIVVKKTIVSGWKKSVTPV